MWIDDGRWAVSVEYDDAVEGWVVVDRNVS
jgi:hypothetical protein